MSNLFGSSRMIHCDALDSTLAPGMRTHELGDTVQNDSQLSSDSIMAMMDVRACALHLWAACLFVEKVEAISCGMSPK